MWPRRRRDDPLHLGDNRPAEGRDRDPPATIARTSAIGRSWQQLTPRSANGGHRPAPDPDGPQPGTLCTFPLFHIAGIAMICHAVLTGGKLVTQYKWDPDEAVELVQRRNGSPWCPALPTVIPAVRRRRRRSGTAHVNWPASAWAARRCRPSWSGAINTVFSSSVHLATPMGSPRRRPRWS